PTWTGSFSSGGPCSATRSAGSASPLFCCCCEAMCAWPNGGGSTQSATDPCREARTTRPRTRTSRLLGLQPTPHPHPVRTFRAKCTDAFAGNCVILEVIPGHAGNPRFSIKENYPTGTREQLCGDGAASAGPLRTWQPVRSDPYRQL